MVSFRIAARFLRHSRGQTILIVVGIGVAISVQLFVGLLISSLQVTLIENIVGNSPQVTVSPGENETSFSGWQAMMDDIRGLSAVTDITASASSSGLFRYGAEAKPVVVRGFDFTTVDGIYGITARVYEGTLPEASSDVLVGKETAEKLNIPVGGDVSIITTNGSVHGGHVSGLFDFRVQSLNEGWILTGLENAQTIFGFGGNVTSIEIQVKDVFKADAVAQDVASLVGSSVQVDNWKDQNKQLLDGLRAQSISSTMIQTFILIAIVIAIASVLAITVLQKSRQIGIMKAMGIKDRQASLVFLYEGLMLGIGGAVAGILIGLFLLTGFSAATSGSEGALLKIQIDYGFIALSGLIAILSAIFASVIPARKSSKLSPIEVIRGG